MQKPEKDMKSIVNGSCKTELGQKIGLIIEFIDQFTSYEKMS